MGQDPSVITGYNTDIKHNDRVFHVQTEDKGLANPVIESLVYTGGKIIASRQYSYASLLRDGYNEKTVQEILDSQHRKVMRDIRGGKYDPEGPPPFGAGIITQRSFDDVVLEFFGDSGAEESFELIVREGQKPRAGDVMVLNLLVQTEGTSRPVAGADVALRLISPEGDRTVTLFEGKTEESGAATAGVDIPRDFGGGTLVIEASTASGADAITLEVLPA
ncbi:MAG TPA: hypothetical protein VFP98_04885 [Candidatus Polarisedimenticolia bacterium]|nr:hypothetical protein [Candidatus Polarisedimenticolia bacterium]